LTAPSECLEEDPEHDHRRQRGTADAQEIRLERGRISGLDDVQALAD
jgi:hypothetical protein